MLNNSFCNDDFNNSTIWLFMILLIFGAGGPGNCNFWSGYCNAFNSSAFNTNSIFNNTTGNFFGNNFPS